MIPAANRLPTAVPIAVTASPCPKTKIYVFTQASPATSLRIGQICENVLQDSYVTPKPLLKERKKKDTKIKREEEEETTKSKKE